MSALEIEIAAAEEAEQADRRRVRQQQSVIDRQREEIEKLRLELDFTQAIDTAALKPPAWLREPKSKKPHRGTVCLLLTDTHFDEVVNPVEIDFLNAYDRTIAEKRLRRWANKAIEVSRDYISGIAYDGAVLFVGGDILSGSIHDELKETNAATTYASVVHWIEPLYAAINLLAGEFGRLHVACVVGNHGRATRKPRAKRRAEDNIEWLIYRWLEREFRPDKRVTFQVSDAADLLVSVYSTRYLLTHGDQFRGGSGIAGMFSPLMLGSHRKSRRQLAAGKPYDWMVLGHWHQFWIGKGLIVGGTLKGMDEYAWVSNFEPEPPTQAFWITTPENGLTISAPIFVSDRASEGW